MTANLTLESGDDVCDLLVKRTVSAKEMLRDDAEKDPTKSKFGALNRNEHELKYFLKRLYLNWHFSETYRFRSKTESWKGKLISPLFCGQNLRFVSLESHVELNSV